MSKPVYLMTVQETHKDYNTLIDQIWAKYELLDLGECGKIAPQHLMLHALSYLI